MDREPKLLEKLYSTNIKKNEVLKILHSTRSTIQSKTRNALGIKEGYFLDGPLNNVSGQIKSSLYHVFSDSAGVLVAKVYSDSKDAFDNEVEMAARFNHGNIIKFIKSFQISDHLDGIIMPFFPKSVNDLFIQYKVVPIKAITTIARDCFFALEHIHSIGYCYGDFKPSNVMLESGEIGHAVLVDFGSAVKLGSALIEYSENYCLCKPSIGTREIDWICYGSTLAQLAGLNIIDHSNTSLIDIVSQSTIDSLLKTLIISALKPDITCIKENVVQLCSVHSS